MIAFWLGACAGMLHVITGPDHLAAVSAIAARDALRAVRIGVAWGLGHGLGVVALGIAIQAFALVELTTFSSWAERLIGVALLWVGARVVWNALKRVPSNAPLAFREREAGALGIGVVHGAAGGGHVFGVLPSLAFPYPQALAYLGSYLVAAVLSMALAAAALGSMISSRSAAMRHRLELAIGAMTAATGLAWLTFG